MEKENVFDEFLDGSDVEVVYKCLYTALKNAFDLGYRLGKSSKGDDEKTLQNVLSFKRDKPKNGM